MKYIFEKSIYLFLFFLLTSNAALAQQKKTNSTILVPREYEAPKSNAVAKAVNEYDSKLAHNQQIIGYLKLAPSERTGSQYIVQVGKFANVRNAERLVQRLQDKYDYPVKIHYERQGDTPLQVVYIGEFSTKSEAIAANKNLKWIKRKGIVKKF